MPAGSAAAWSRSPFAEHDAALFKIVGSHLHNDAITDHRANLETPHLARSVSDDPVVILQTHGEPSVRKNFLDLTIKL